MKTVVISGPGKNALSSAVMAKLLAALRAASGDPVLLVGEGDAFSAGLNLKELAALDEAGLLGFLSTLEDLVETLYERDAPTVAWVNGHAIAGGAVLALACDVRVMTARHGARIGLPETPLGLQFPPRTFEMIRRRLSPAVLERVILEGGAHDATTALRLGLVDVIGEEDEARARLVSLAASPLHVYAAAKRAIRGRLAVPAEAEARFRAEVVPEWASPALKERLLAVLRR